MKDRTLILAGLLFLTVAIAVGVNKSLEEGNRMVGVPMAPELESIYAQKVPEVREQARDIVYSQAKAAAALLEEGLRTCRQKLAEAAVEVQNKAVEVQNKVAEVKERITLEKN